MVPIYLKLADGHNYFKDESLDFELIRPTKLAGVLDYSNLNYNIWNGITTGVLTQITSNQFNGEESDSAEPIPINIPSLELSRYLEGCPVDTAVMWVNVQGTFYKILWSKVKECLRLVPKYRKVIRVGIAAAPWPQDGDTSFTHPELIGKNHNNLMVTLNGVELYHKSLIPEGELSWRDYYDLDPTTGLFSRLIKFSITEILSITEL